MTITPGTRFGPYEILAPIGSGGMGEVYKARDTRLDRSVAIKILPSHLSFDKQLRERFDREARMISSISHPHICSLYDVGNENGVDYLVMELLEGTSLADKLSRGALPLDQVLRFGAQIAQALDRAHKAGVVHRDLKPGNVMITKSGAKLLDFGLAKLVSGVVTTDAPTEQQKPLTQEGTILGTFQYMAPEQLEGQQADARTDIFALGCVLYEMATGQRAFQGKTKTSLIAAIVDRTPVPISQIIPLTPPFFEHVVEKCLEKEPDERWQSAHDIAEELKWIERRGNEDQQAGRTKGRWRWLPWIAAVVGITSALLLAILYVRGRNARSSELRFSFNAPPNLDFENFSVSPSGDAIAFSADPRDGEERSLWVRRLNAAEPGAVARGPRMQNPFWSPDGAWIGYFAGRKLWKVRAAGGSPQLICDAEYGVGASWDSSGTILFSPAFGQGIFQVSVAGGEARAVTQLDPRKRESIHAWPRFLPGGDRFLFLVRTIAAESNQIFVGSLVDGQRRLLLKADALSGYLEPDLYFVRNGTLFSQEVDLDEARMLGEPRRVLDHVSFNESLASAAVSISERTIAYFPFSHVPMELRWYDRSGKSLEAVATDQSFEEFQLSRNGRKLVYERADPIKGGDDIWVTDLSRGARSRLTAGRADHQFSVWSPDAASVAFSSDQGGMYDVYVQPSDASAAPRPLWISPIDKNVCDWSPDGKYLAVNVYDPVTRDDLWLVPLSAGEKPRPIMQSEYSEEFARFSPDGRYISYVSDRSGQEEVYVRHLESGKTEQVSIKGGVRAQWARDGSELFFLTVQKKLMAATLKLDGATIVPSTPTELFQFGGVQFGDFAVGADGRFLIRGVTDTAITAQSLHVIYGFNSSRE